MAYRFDRGRLGKAQRTPQGGVRVDAFLTRVGILTYRTPDGGSRLEYRPAEEVFRADSLATLASAPVTEGHAAMVTSSNWKELSIGHVEPGARQDGEFVAAPLVVQDGTKLPRLDSGDLGELSAGYEVDYDPTPGTFQGQRYDGVQRNIRYNHVALLPPGTGRAGRDCALRLDSASAVLDELPAPSAPPKDKTMIKFRFDGRDYEVATQEQADELLARLKKGVADTARADAAEETLIKVKADLALANDHARIDAAVKTRVELCTSASKFLGAEYKFDGKTDRQIREDSVRVEFPEFKSDGKSDDYVSARFDSCVEKGASQPITALPGILGLPAPRTQTRTDAAPIDSEAARKKMIEDNSNAWKSKSAS